MSLLTFLEIVLAVVIGRNTELRTLVNERECVKFWLSVFEYGFVVVDSRVKGYNYAPRKGQTGTDTKVLIKTVVDRGEWHLRLGKYYVFFTTP
jgi:hypothetical protein